MNSLLTMLHSAAQAGSEFAKRLAQSPQLAGSSQATSDPLGRIAAGLLSTSTSAMPRIGVIVDYIPHIRSYRVQPEGGGPLLQCNRLVYGNTQPLGVTDADTYQPGTAVYFFKHPQTTFGTIIGALPFRTTNSRTLRADWTSPGSRAGLATDPAHLAGFAMGGKNKGGGIRGWNARSPMDATGVGEFSRITETGLNLHLDAYMLQARVDEYCGLWLFYWDQLCRLAGYNFQHWTCGSVQESFDDEGEHFYYRGIATYVWEQFGQYGEPRPAFTKNQPKTVQIDKPYLGYLEPSQQSMQPFHRTQFWSGYLGQGSKEIQIVPPASGYVQDYNNYTEKLIGVAERNVFLDGHIGDRSARGVSITKRAIIPVPKQRRLPPDKKGDTAKNYKAAGKLGEGKDHKLVSQPAPPSKHGSLVNAASIADLHAYLFNWKGAHPFHYHEKDFELPEESELTDMPSNQKIPEFKKLKTATHLEPPTPIEVTVDHRHKAKIYPNHSGFELLDDGGVLIFDGFGSELKMTGGNIHVTCPGDIFMEAGRNVISWGGRDVIIRANKSVDVTANRGDARVMAGHNVQILAANLGGEYGLLLESRGEGKGYNFEEPGESTKGSGIMFKSANAPIVAWAGDMYLRSTSGNIVLDANKGSGNIDMHAGNHNRFIGGTAADYFGTDGSISSANIWQSSQAIIDCALFVAGPLTSSGGHVMRGNVLVVGGHIYTEAGDEKVRPLEGVGLTAAEAAIRTREEAVSRAEKQGADKYKSELQSPWYDEKKAGSDDVIKNAQCSLRVLDDYSTKDFLLVETRWAQMARLGGTSPDTWTENPVKFRGQDTYPYPGKEHFTDSSYWLINTQLYDMTTGQSKDRGEIYESAKLAEPTAVKLNGRYPIVG